MAEHCTQSYQFCGGHWDQITSAGAISGSVSSVLVPLASSIQSDAKNAVPAMHRSDAALCNRTLLRAIFSLRQSPRTVCITHCSMETLSGIPPTGYISGMAPTDEP